MREKNEFVAFAEDLFGVPRGSLSPETAMGSIPQWDSVMHVRLAMETEAAFGVAIPFDRLAEIRTLAGFAALVAGAHDAAGK